MKLTVCLSASIFALLAWPGGVCMAAPSDEDDNEAWSQIVSKPATSSLSNEEREGQEKQEADEAISRNWLLAGFEEQTSKGEKQSETEGKNKDGATDLYLQLSENKDLARLAGLPAIDPTSTVDAPAFHATPAPASDDKTAQNSVTLRPDSNTDAKQDNDPLKPLVPLDSTLNSPATQASQPYFLTTFATPMSSILAPTVPLQPTQAQKPATVTSALSTRPSPIDTIDMETPGMIASKNEPLTGPPDLVLDSLPDQNQPDDAAAAQLNNAPPQLQQAMDADQMHTDQTTQLSVALPSNVLKPAASLQAKQAPTALQALQQAQTLENSAPPISQQPMISPVHAPIPGPADFLNR